MLSHFNEIKKATDLINTPRALGACIAAEINTNKDISYAFRKQALEKGALLRPLGNTLYWLPPLTIEDDSLAALKNITQQTLIDIA